MANPQDGPLPTVHQRIGSMTRTTCTNSSRRGSSSYYRLGRRFRTRRRSVNSSEQSRIVNPGFVCVTRLWPHAGILNTTAFLYRYPTTATNRNRARSRWTYYHFLGLDIEKSASRTTDPVALADTNNPTMHNPACTVCHSVLDPVAGAFQNYGNEGKYKVPVGEVWTPSTRSLQGGARNGAVPGPGSTRCPGRTGEGAVLATAKLTGGSDRHVDGWPLHERPLR